MKISIFGLGYVGCVSLGCLAKNGNKVIGVDINQTKVDLVNHGRPTIIEDEIDNIIKTGHEKGIIDATTDYLYAVENTDLSIICVGTPSTTNGTPNLKYVYDVASQIGEGLKNKSSFHTIVIRSTVLPGTNNKVGEIIEKVSGKRRNIDFGVVSNPEFMREGSAVYDYYNPPMIVLGSDNNLSINIMKKLYADINAPIIETDIKVAEFIKYVNNAFHALKVSFANEIGNICKKLNMDSHELMNLFVIDKKLNLSSYYLKPGFAYGGSCLPKDLKALKTISHDFYLDSPIIESIERSNENQIKTALVSITKHDMKNICFLGLSFKAGTDDLRNSPAVELIEQLLGKGYNIKIFDKKVQLSELTGANKEYIEKTIPHLAKLLERDMQKVIEFSDILVITNNDEKFKDVLEIQDKIIVDLVRISKEASSDNYEGICW